MAHGSKKWIKDWKGRIKRSRKRTQQDWLGQLAAPCTSRWQREKNCPQCKALAKIEHISHWHVRIEVGPPAEAPRGLDRKAYVRWYYRTRHKPWRVFEDGRYWIWIAVSSDDLHLYARADRRPIYWYGETECRSCREKDRTLSWGRHNGDRACRFASRGVPAEYRREITREQRAAYRNLMQRAKYDSDLYDDVPLRYNRDAAYRYW